MPFPPGPRFWEGNTRVPGNVATWGAPPRTRDNYPLVPMKRPGQAAGAPDPPQNFQSPVHLSQRIHRLAQFPVLHDGIPDIRPYSFSPNPPTLGRSRADEAYYTHERGIDAASVPARPAAPAPGPCAHCLSGVGPSPFLTCRIFPTRPTLNGGENDLNRACTNCFYLGRASNANMATLCSIAVAHRARPQGILPGSRGDDDARIRAAYHRLSKSHKNAQIRLIKEKHAVEATL